MLIKESIKGFTLIELLVVIGIIGVLSSVVLASLNTARGKGSNAAIKSGMANMRAQAELYYGASGYTGVCANTVTGIGAMLAQSTSTGGGPTGALNTYCVDGSGDWSAYAKLKVAEGTINYWCVGSSGASKGAATLPSPMLVTSCQ